MQAHKNPASVPSPVWDLGPRQWGSVLSVIGMGCDLVGVLIIRNGTKLDRWGDSALSQIGTSMRLEEADRTFASWSRALQHLATSVKATNRLTGIGTWWLVAGFSSQAIGTWLAGFA